MSFVDETCDIIDICNDICEDYKFYYDVTNSKYDNSFKIIFTSMENNNLKATIIVEKNITKISHSATYHFILRALKDKIIDWFRT